MTARPLETLAASFADAATAATRAEAEFRASLRTRLDQLERERSHAHRRWNLIKDLIAETESLAPEADGERALQDLLAREYGLEWSRPPHAAVLDQFRPVAQALLALAHPPAADAAPDAQAEPAPDVILALAVFEAWYLATTGVEFLTLADLYTPQTPTTDW